MRFVEKISEKVHGFLTDHPRVAPAVAGAGMLSVAAVGALATGGASAADTNTTEVVKYFGMSPLELIFGALTAIMAVGTVFLKDWRLAIVTVVMAIVTLITGYYAF